MPILSHKLQIAIDYCANLTVLEPAIRINYYQIIG